MSKTSGAAVKGSAFEGFEFKKIDLRKFNLKTKKPNVNTLRDINDDFRIVQKAQFASEKDFNKAASLLRPVTSGPYSVKLFTANESLVLARNPNWWAYSLPEIKNLFNFDLLKYSIVSDPALAYEKLIKGDIDLLNLNLDNYRHNVKGGDKDKFDASNDGVKPLWAAHFKSKNSPTVTFLNWNEKNTLFQSREVRQALAQLVDYKSIISNVYGDEADRSFSPFGSNTPNTDPSLEKTQFELNIEKAVTLLSKEGWKDHDSSGRLSKAIDGTLKFFEFTILYNSENTLRGKIAQILKENFRRAGIIANVQALEYNAVIDKISKHDYDSVIFNFGGGSINADAEGLWASKSIQGGFNFGSYKNPRVDDLILKASSELDPKKHFAINRKISKIIYEDQPAIFLLEVNGTFVGFNKKNIDSTSWFSQFDFNPPVERYFSKSLL
jgi:ABC-type transport system substrate-binding protein